MIVFILILILIYFIKKNNRIDPNYKVEINSNRALYIGTELAELTDSKEIRSSPSPVQSRYSTIYNSDLLPKASVTRKCPKDRRLTKVCSEMDGDRVSTPPNCKVVNIKTSIGWVCQERSQGKRANNWGSFHDNDFRLPETSRAEILQRAKEWIDEGIRYSQLRYHKSESVERMYRTDCSGLFPWLGYYL